MADQVQLIAQVRFALEQLSERNAQHEWEHLSRHLARERVCANILPATGPVQAGGDQGRDFETFRTYLQASPLKERSFVGLVSDRPLAFACTLEKSVGSKVRRDVATIMASGTPISGIYFFASRGLPVAKRHELQEWCRRAYDVSLEVLDGEAVSELLSDRDLYWIAERYLQMPSELLPPSLPIEPKDWYSRTLEKWRRNEKRAHTFAHFSEIRSAARHARGPFEFGQDGEPIDRYEQPEFPFWLQRLDELAETEDFPLLSRRAFYEASVQRLRGLGSLVGQETRLRSFFSAIPQLGDAAEIEDATTLLNYLWGAQARGRVGLEPSELRAWTEGLSNHLDERIRQAKKQDRPNELCALLESRGGIAMFGRFDEGVFDASSALSYWGRLAKAVGRAPLFPLERFADRLAKYVPYIGTFAEYEPLTQSLDALLAERFGQFKAAEKCLERARAFYAGGDLTRVMAQLHRAKVDWFAEETLDRALLALDLLSSAYQKQGLHFASKYYVLAIGYLALHSPDLSLKPQVAPALSHAASCDYVMGAWHGFLELSQAAADFYPHFAKDPQADFNTEGGFFQAFEFNLGVATILTKLLHPEMEDFARSRCLAVARRLGLGEVVEDVVGEGVEVFGRWGSEKLWGAIEEQLAGPPWSDAGDTRRVRWDAHGVTWEVDWKNDYETTLVAEEFLAGLQLFLSDLAGYDLCLLRSTLSVTLDVATSNGFGTGSTKTRRTYFHTRFAPSNTGRQATVTLPPYNLFRDGTLLRDDILLGILGVISSLLEGGSLLPTKRFTQILEERFSHGLSHKLFVAATYAQCLHGFITEEDFNASSRPIHKPLAPPDPFSPPPSEQLPWYSGPGPGYSEEIGVQMTRNRYENFSRRLRLTLKRLSQEEEFLATVRRLREGGWKDWHILSMVYHVTMNYRLNLTETHLPLTKANIEAYSDLPEECEDDSPVPLDLYSEAGLRKHMPFYLLSVIKTFGMKNDLELHQQTPDLPGIEDFLTSRYNFWSDDIDHEDYFQAGT